MGESTGERPRGREVGGASETPKTKGVLRGGLLLGPQSNGPALHATFGRLSRNLPKEEPEIFPYGAAPAQGNGLKIRYY